MRKLLAITQWVVKEAYWLAVAGGLIFGGWYGFQYLGENRDVAEAAPGAIEEEVTVRFDSSYANGMPWEVTPVELKQRIRIGEEGLAFYEAYNPTDRPVAGTASYNVTPYAAGGYFSKIDCFCFEMQLLDPGQRVQMPVTFYVDPAITRDRQGKFVHTITLSYTFYETDLPEEQAALDTQSASSVN